MTGSVAFQDGNVVLSSAAVMWNPSTSTGGATLNAPNGMLGGQHTITAVYSGDGNYSGSTSAALTQTVNPVTPGVMLTSSAQNNTAVYGQPVTLTAQVSIDNPGVATAATGTVTFKDGSSTLGTAALVAGPPQQFGALATASLTDSTLSPGVHSLTASYPGDRNYASAVSSPLSLTVNPASTSTTLTSSANPSALCQPVTFTATVNAVSPGSGTPTGNVSFQQNGTTVATVNLTNGVATYSTSALTQGSYSFTAVYNGDGNAVPSQIQVQLTWNGVALTSRKRERRVVYPSLTLPARQPVVVNTSSPFGAGWSLGGIPSLLLGSAGIAIVDNSSGGSRYFTGTGPSYTSPANDQGTLVQNGDGSYTYTSKDQIKTNFDSTGRMTSQVDPHGLSQMLAYSGTLLSTITQPDGGVATFNFSGGLLSSIQLPGSRTLTPTYTGSDLTGFTDAAGGAYTFGYDTSHRLTSEKVGPLNIAYAYSSSNGTLTQIDRGLGTTLAVKAAAVQGLGASTAINANQAFAALTDGLNHTTNYLLDALGRLMQLQTADSAIQSWQLNAAGNPSIYIDQLGRATSYAYNATQDLTQVLYPDGTSKNYQYEMTFHQVTQIQDALNRLTKLSYDTTTGDLLTHTDALNDVTTYTWSNGLKQTTTDALNHVTTLQWDSATRRQTATIDALNNQTNYGYDAAGNQNSVQDALGHTTTFTFDGNRRQLTRTNALSGVSSNTYDAAGNLLSSTDEEGRLTNYAYDQRGFQVSVTVAVGTPQQGTTTTTYDAAGNELSVTDAEGDVTQYGYDVMNRQVSRTEAYGTSDQRTTTTTYDLAGNMATTVDAKGATTQYVYDVRNRVVQRIDAYGTSSQKTTITTYDAVGNTLTVTDPRGTVTNYVYDALNRQTQQIDDYGAPLQRTSITTVYDAVSNVTSQTNAAGAVTNYVYDAVNRQTQIIEAYNSPEQRTSTKVYDAVGNVLSITNPRGNVTTHVYDALNRGVQQVDASGTSVQRTLTATYDAVSNLLTVTNGLGMVTSFGYDALNRRVTQTDAYGTSLARTLTTNYDANDNVISTVDALGNMTTYGYDVLNRQISVQNPDGGTSTTAYDANDNVLSVTDELRHTTTHVYDVLNRRIQTTDARGGIVTWTFDANNNLLSLTDPVNNVTQWVYDALNRKVQEIDPLGNNELYAYDALDRLTSSTDRNGQQIASTYDLLNRKTGETWYNASGSQVNALTFTYDANDNLLTATNNAGTITRTYDPLDRLATVQDTFGTTLTNTYDAADNRTQVQDSFGATTTRIFDVLNRVTSLQLGGTSQTPLREDFTYTARDQVATQTRYSDLAGQNKIGSSSFTFDSVGRLTNLQHLNGSGANIANYVNAFDLASRITSETLNAGTPTNYTYDVTNELTNDSVMPYSYDLNGNRTMAGYTTGQANELTSDGIWNYVFDANGNVVGKTNISTGETWSYGYDNRNRLVSATQTTASVLQMQATYVYDALGERIEKDVWTQSIGSTVTTRFAYDGGEIWADLTSTNALQTRYVRGERVLELLARIASGAVAWILADRMGSVQNVLDNTGAVIDTIIYDGYGNVVSETSPANGGQYRYDGYRNDSEIGWLRPDVSIERYFDTLTGLWLSQDPFGLEPDSNLYRYVGNNPTNLVDPDGTDFIAIADRRVKVTAIRYHYSLEYWRSNDNGPSEGMQIEEWLKSHVGTKVGSVELLRLSGQYETWAWLRRRRERRRRWAIRKVSISVITYNEDKGNRFVCIFNNKNAAAVQRVWNNILQIARQYRYAEQNPNGKGFNGKFSHWPDSRYVLSLQDPTNSNTFVKYVVSEAKLIFKALPGDHPGAAKPKGQSKELWPIEPWRRGSRVHPGRPGTRPKQP